MKVEFDEYHYRTPCLLTNSKLYSSPGCLLQFIIGCYIFNSPPSSALLAVAVSGWSSIYNWTRGGQKTHSWAELSVSCNFPVARTHFLRLVRGCNGSKRPVLAVLRRATPGTGQRPAGPSESAWPVIANPGVVTWSPLHGPRHWSLC